MRVYVAHDPAAGDAGTDYLIRIHEDGTGDFATRPGHDVRSITWSPPIPMRSEDTPPPEVPAREDVHALAEAFVKRMTWPSMHWRTQSIDYDAAAALALLALQHAPNIIATSRVKQQAMQAATEGAK